MTTMPIFHSGMARRPVGRSGVLIETVPWIVPLFYPKYLAVMVDNPISGNNLVYWSVEHCLH